MASVLLSLVFSVASCLLLATALPALFVVVFNRSRFFLLDRVFFLFVTLFSGIILSSTMLLLL